jgi:hypothetical protein
MEEDDLAVEVKASGEPCPRCLEPVPQNAARCPNCGQPISSFRRMTTIMAGVAGVVALTFLFVVAYRMFYLPDQDPTPVEEQAAPDGTFAPPPETSSGHETPAPAPADSTPPAPPEAPKKPPLDR